MGIKKRTGSYFFSSNTVVNYLILSLFFTFSLSSIQAQTVSITPDRDGEEGGLTGRFLITVSDFGLTFLENIDIVYTVSGTAVAGDDYVDLPNYEEGDDTYEINISYGVLGANSAIIEVTVIDESLVDGDKTLTITLQPDVSYALGSPTEATISLVDNDECPTIAPALAAGQPTAFCDSFSVDLNNYTATPAPPNSVLTWSTNSDPLDTGSHLGNTTVTAIGTYYGFFYDAVNNCASAVLPVSLTLNTTPAITGNTPGSRCGPGTVILEATANGGTINWYNTAVSLTVLGSGETFNTPGIAATRSYFVSTTLNGCTSERTEVQATINPIPTITGTTPAARCGPGSVTLGASASAGTINWFASETGGTSLFTGTSFITPEITETTIYYVEAAANDCTTATRTAVTATVNIQPSAGTPSDTSSCNDNDNGTTTVDLDNLITGASPGNWAYTSGPQGNVPFNGQNVVNFNNRPDGEYVFTFTTTGAVAPCTNQSSTVTISVSDCAAPCDAGNTAPTLNTDVPTIFCDAFSQDLDEYTNSTPPAGTVLRWSTNSDPTEVNAHLTNTTVTSPGSYFAFFYDEVNDCGSPVLTVNLQQNVTPTITSTTPGSNCGAGGIVLGASASSGATLRWYDTPTSTQVLAVGTSFTTPSISETRDFFVEATANGCTTERLAVTATVNPPSAGTPTNTSACSLEGSGGPTSIDLDNTLTGAESGVWTITSDPSGDLVIGEGNTVNFLGRPDGEYIFTYTTDTAAAPCVNDSVEVTISVTDCLDPIDLALTKTADRTRVRVGQEVVFTITVALEIGDLALDVVVQDQIPSGFSFISADASLGTYNAITGLWEIPELIEGDMATLTLTVSVLEDGDYENIATINESFPVDGNNANNEESVTIQVDIPSNTECGFLFNQFSPNEDGVNDTLYINCIENYPNNAIEIFDRYGNSVFQANRYNNTWRGTGKNGDIPKGTYFYILDLGDGSEVRKGWIQIIR